MKQLRASLHLEDGTVFEGRSFGAPVSSQGEVVFNTGMVGYPEAFTDPSYRGQVLTMTYPMVGSYGVPAGPFESGEVQISGLLVQQYVDEHSHAEAVQSLGEWLAEAGVPAITGIDTRALTKKLREKGVMLGQIVIEGEQPVPKGELQDPNARNLSAEVSVNQPIILGEDPNPAVNAKKKTIIAVDCGMKESIVDHLVARDVIVKRVPWDYNFLNEKWDGLFLSNGPGDPTMVKETIAHVREALKTNKPIFGICLGSQIMALASGAKTYKLKYGHRSQNQPCIDLETQRCYLTTQNHGFAVDETTLKKDWKVWYRNANDNCVEGIKHKKKPHFSVQYHPEATPGPEDSTFLFDTFIDLVKKQ